MDLNNSDNDYELLYMIYQMDEDSLKILMDKYSQMASVMLRYYFSTNGNMRYHDEVLHICVNKLYQAIYQYRQDRNCSFATFIRHVVIHAALNFYRDLRAHKEQFHMLSLDYYVCEEAKSLAPVIINQDPTLEGISILDIENCKATLKDLFRYMRKWEREVVLLRIQGYQYQEISEILKIDARQVEYVLSKLRNIKL